MKTNSKMSLFNKYTDSEKNVIYKKHEIQNVFWDDTKSVNLNMGIENDNEVNVFIPKNANDFSNYNQPNFFIGLANTWTLKEGDFIVKGETFEDEVQGIKQLKEKYNNVFTITTVSDKDFGSQMMQHFHIKGK